MVRKGDRELERTGSCGKTRNTLGKEGTNLRTNVNGQTFLNVFHVFAKVFAVEISAFRTHSTNSYRTRNGHSEDLSRLLAQTRS